MKTRKIVFYVQTMVWDNIYSCYYAKCIFQSENYSEAEGFCFNYKGPESDIFIQKSFKYVEVPND